MKVALLEPFFTGSHKSWAEGLASRSEHEIRLFKMKGNFWKWRMHGGAVTLAWDYLESNFRPDLILGTSMLDFTTFLSLTREKTSGIKTAIYFHENQLTYPKSVHDHDVKLGRDRHYGFINIMSALCADRVFFNSTFHQTSFLKAAFTYLKAMPDYQETDVIKGIELKSQILHLGMDLKRFDEFRFRERRNVPIILWNHRWELDKNPGDFFQILRVLKMKGRKFKLNIIGEHYEKYPEIFDKAKEEFSHEILRFGYQDSFEEYAKTLWESDIALVTSHQDFFGMSVAEAIYCENMPVLPDRLAYPGLYGDKTQFYETTDQAIQKIEAMMDRWPEADPCPDWAARFDWDDLIRNYDLALEF